ncbi:hypothetical protein FNV43_RR20579 [Rhamnella rubrinervis]|uniref:Nudix hydrolase domain-containing protein n=1 Tax=Rhamnella rubrinervis TaxID=2594499 RepID=A0A8K0E0M1_9ROSA|nr:hypothetical protein FNV43_RR20579 [Rhamnella rubrinervis]
MGLFFSRNIASFIVSSFSVSEKTRGKFSQMQLENMVSLVSRTGRHLQRYDKGCRQVVGCIPYRYRNSKQCSSVEELEVLVISSQKGQAMMFPKGGWEIDESIEEAASRETLEEAGVLGKVECALGTWRYKSKSHGKDHVGYMFPLLVKEQLDFWPEKNVRKRRWITVAEAKQQATMGRLPAKSDYENLRNARILENQTRLSTLGLNKTLEELRSVASSAKSTKPHVKNYTKKVYGTAPLRRSDRLRKITSETTTETPKNTKLRRSARLGAKHREEPISGKVGVHERSEETFCSNGREEHKRPANMPLVKINGKELHLSLESSSRRCNSKGRGSVYDPVFGICCHFCRQKTLCGEEECKRCGNFDMDQPCIGKTDCSVCHSSNGVLCRACLKVRYGEELEEVRERKKWMCPHCIEENGTNPYWICNSSLCLKKRKMAPTGIAIYRAKEMGYKSVAHLLMDELQKAIKC